MRERLYDIGDSVRLTAEFTAPDSGAPVDPALVRLRIMNPAGTTEVFEHPGELVRISAGVYRRVVPVEASGVWAYRFEGSGAVNAAAESKFRVRASAFNLE